MKWERNIQVIAVRSEVLHVSSDRHTKFLKQNKKTPTRNKKRNPKEKVKVKKKKIKKKKFL